LAQSWTVGSVDLRYQGSYDGENEVKAENMNTIFEEMHKQRE